MSKHAVLTDTHVVWISETERKVARCGLPIHAQHISELWSMGQDLNVTHFWIMPGSAIDKMGWSFLSEKEGWKVFIPGEKDLEAAPRSAACKKGYAKGTFEIVVNYPASGNGFAWIVKTPLDVLAAVDYLKQLLGIDTIEYSPQHIGKDYLKEQYKATARLQSYIAKPVDDLSTLPFRQAAPEIYYARPLLPVMVGMWYHGVDKNSAHPSAASSMMTGTGTPVHLVDDIVPQKPGIYRVSFGTGASLFDGVNLPLIIESEWVTLDVLKFAIKQGYNVQIHEAFVFEHAYNVFGQWARGLWSARQALKDSQRFPHTAGRENAYFAMKDIMNTSISAMKDNVNWWADMVGMARTARLANLYKFATDCGQYPLYVYVDDMAFLSTEDLVQVAIPGILDRSDKLGGYKHTFSLQITEEMVQDCSKFAHLPGKQAAAKMHGYFKKIAREGVLIDA